MVTSNSKVIPESHPLIASHQFHPSCHSEQRPCYPLGTCRRVHMILIRGSGLAYGWLYTAFMRPSCLLFSENSASVRF